MADIGPFLTELTDFTNNLDNFNPLGVFYCYDLPPSLAPPLAAPDGWGWCDFPYVESPSVGNGSWLSGPMVDIRYLVHRAHARVTYKVDSTGIAVCRVYMLPNGERDGLIRKYRDEYMRLRKSPAWHRRAYEKIIGRLISVLDYSESGWNGEFHPGCLISATTDMPKAIGQTKWGVDDLSHHLQRLRWGKRFSRRPKIPIQELEQALVSIYESIDSPMLEIPSELHDNVMEILHGQVPGLKSNLYVYQRQSVAAMFIKESAPTCVPLPSILVIPRKGFLDLDTMSFVTTPGTYWTPRGGILAENMGLGKSCICLALLCATKHQISETPAAYRSMERKHPAVRSLVDCCVDHISQNSIPWRQFDVPEACQRRLEKMIGYFDQLHIDQRSHFVRGKQILGDEFGSISSQRLYLASTTLAVVPDNLFNQWKMEIIKHVEPGFLKVFEVGNVRTELPPVAEIVKYDVVLISLNAFSRQSDDTDSVLLKIYWKRLIVDEGHSMNSKYTKAIEMASQLQAERRWIITGTPTVGLTNLTVSDSLVKQGFNAKTDLSKLGVVVGKFLRIDPWSSNARLWSNTIIKPLEQGQFNSNIQLKRLLRNLMVRHRMKDVERDVQLPALHHRAVFLKPSYFDTLSINLFTAVLATNAVTSERTGHDYMFDSSNKINLRRLINNLQKATFYWTGFSIDDIENLLKICEYSLEKHDYSKADCELLMKSIKVSNMALSNRRWRTNSAVHEMSYFVKNLPPTIEKEFALSQYKDVGVYGFPQLIAIQRFYYKHRLISSEDELQVKMEEYTKEFWENYLRMNDSLNDKRRRKVTNSELDFKSIDIDAIQQINDNKWVSAEPERKKLKVELSSLMRSARILGTASSKLSYLASRLLENQELGIKSIVFYEFENSAYYLTELLDILGANYVMYSSHIAPQKRSNNLVEFDQWTDRGVALVMDLRLASHGLTILGATHVFFISPVWNRATEAQAIKRSHRIGQTKEVFVETLILEDTIEQQVYYHKPEVREKRQEVIDNANIKEFVLQFNFLPISKGEIAPVESATNCGESATDYSDVLPTGYTDNLEYLQMDCAHSRVKDQVRRWQLPVFTEQSMDKLFQGDLAKKRRGNGLSRKGPE